MKLFKQKINPLKTFVFSKKGFLVLFFLLFIVITFSPMYNANADGPGAGTLTSSSASMQRMSKAWQEESCSLWDLPRCFVIVMFKFAGFLFSLSSVLFGWMIDTDNIKYIISDNTAIYSSWAFVRDILNMAFIMVLLFSAFCTIFKIEQYNYKKLLWKIVLMALLVNFSFPIARFIIDASNILMYTLIGNLFGTSGTTGTEAVKSFGIIAKGSAIGDLVSINTKDIPSTTILLANSVLIFMLAITFLAIGVLLLIRIVALAILIIFSPLAFTGSIMPGVSSYASQWWNNLFKYSFFGPIMIFGISIAVKLMNDTNTMTELEDIATNSATAQVGSQSAIDPTFLGHLGIAAIPIVLLWMVMGIAQKLSIAGAGAVMGAAQGAMKWSGKNLTGYRVAKFAAGAGVGYVGRKMAKGKYTKFLVPRVYKEAWKQRAAIKDREAYEGSTGEMHDLFNKVLSRGKEKTDFAFAAHEGKVSKYAKEISDVSTNADYVIEQLRTAIANKQVAKVEGALKVLAKENNLNDMMNAIGDKYGDKVKTSSPLHIKEAVRDMLSQAGAGENKKTNEFLTKSLMTVGDVGINAGNMGFAGMGKFDKSLNNGTGGFRITEDREQAEIAGAKFQNLEAQARQRTLHHNSVLGEGADGNVADIDEVQAAILMKFDESDVDQMARSRADLRRQFKAIQTGKDAHGRPVSQTVIDKFKKIKEQNAYLTEYAEAMGKGLAKAGGKEKKEEKTFNPNKEQT